MAKESQDMDVGSDICQTGENAGRVVSGKFTSLDPGEGCQRFGWVEKFFCTVLFQ